MDNNTRTAKQSTASVLKYARQIAKHHKNSYQNIKANVISGTTLRTDYVIALLKLYYRRYDIARVHYGDKGNISYNNNISRIYLKLADYNLIKINSYYHTTYGHAIRYRVSLTILGKKFIKHFFLKHHKIIKLFKAYSNFYKIRAILWWIDTFIIYSWPIICYILLSIYYITTYHFEISISTIIGYLVLLIPFGLMDYLEVLFSNYNRSDRGKKPFFWKDNFNHIKSFFHNHFYVILRLLANKTTKDNVNKFLTQHHVKNTMNSNSFTNYKTGIQQGEQSRMAGINSAIQDGEKAIARCDVSLDYDVDTQYKKEYLIKNRKDRENAIKHISQLFR